MKKFYAFMVAALFLVTGAIAQEEEKTNQEKVEELKTHIRTMYESYLSGPSTLATEEEFLKLFDMRFVGSEVKVDVLGVVDIKKTNRGTMLEDFKNYKKSLPGAGIGNLRFTIKKFHTVAVKGKTGVAALDITFEVFKEGELISKGDQTVSMTLLETNDGWKVTYLSRLYVESEKYLGKCICQIFGNAGADNMGSFATYLTVPDGDEYMELNDRFVISKKGEKASIMKNGDDEYSWNLSTGEITKGTEVIGNARTYSTAIKNVLKYANAERCQRVETKK
jgi:hypothetical protein